MNTRIVTAAVIVTMFVLCQQVHAQNEETELANPNTEGRPVYLIAGKIVVFPEGVEEPPDGYEGSIGATPIALVKIDDTIVGEIYAAQLEGTTIDEAKSMAASADNIEEMELQERATIQDDGEDVEVVTLKVNLDSNVGTPWIFHSLYFPRGTSSSTFKLVASEEQFDTVLPYFETMLFYDGEEPE